MHDTSMRRVAPGTRVVLVAPYLDRPGHYSTFPRDLAHGFESCGVRVEVLHPAPLTSDTVSLRTRCALDELLQVGSWPGKLARRFSHDPVKLSLLWLATQPRTHRPALVYWTDVGIADPGATWWLSLAAWFGLTPNTAFTEHFTYSWSGHRVARWLKLDRLRLHRLHMFVHSRSLLDQVRQVMGWQHAGRYVPWGLQPSFQQQQDRDTARARLSISPTERVLLIFGMQAIERKAIDRLALAISGMTLTRPLTLLFAGSRVDDRAHPFATPDLSAHPNLNCRFIDSYIDEASIPGYFAASDAVWCNYGRFNGALGVLAQTIAMGRMALCSDYGESAALCQQYQLGLQSPADDIPALQACLSRFVDLPADAQARFELAACRAAGEMTWDHFAREVVYHTLPNAMTTN